MKLVATWQLVARPASEEETRAMRALTFFLTSNALPQNFTTDWDTNSMDGESKRHSYAVIKDGFKAFKNKSEPGVHTSGVGYM